MNQSKLLPANQSIITVSWLNKQLAQNLEHSFNLIWIQGEISGLTISHSMHMYFSLKDKHSQIRCIMFRQQTNNVSFKPTSGSQVLILAKVTLYQERGDLQLIVQYMLPLGDGLLQLKLEELKHRLMLEGLFELDKKLKIPLCPLNIGIITSTTAAALADVLSVFSPSYSGINLYLYPTQVQGKTAATSINNAISLANLHNKCEVLLLIRGGGSLEDLWPFNEELVTRAIFGSKIPIITGIGHETDFTIADLVASKRAPTPSLAAKLVIQTHSTIINRTVTLKTALTTRFIHRLAKAQQYLDFLEQKIIHPRTRIRQQLIRLSWLAKNLSTQIKLKLNLATANLNYIKNSLHQLSPLTTLGRGYAILTKENTEIITSTQQVKSDETVLAKLEHGMLVCIIKEIR